MKAADISEYNGFLKITCGNCGNTFRAYYRGDIYGREIRTCPFCLEEIDRDLWEDDVLPAWAGLIDSNFQLRKHASESNSSEFSITFITPTRKE